MLNCLKQQVSTFLSMASSKETKNKKSLPEEEELLELAKKELLREVKCASMRAEQFGAHSWAKPQSYVPSKRFLQHMILTNSSHNKRQETKTLKRKKDQRNEFLQSKKNKIVKSNRESKTEHSVKDHMKIKEKSKCKNKHVSK